MRIRQSVLRCDARKAGSRQQLLSLLPATAPQTSQILPTAIRGKCIPTRRWKTPGQCHPEEEEDAKNKDLREFACRLPPTPSRARYCFRTVSGPCSVSEHTLKSGTPLPDTHLLNSAEILLVDQVSSGSRGVSRRHLGSKRGSGASEIFVAGEQQWQSRVKISSVG